MNSYINTLTTISREIDAVADAVAVRDYACTQVLDGVAAALRMCASQLQQKADLDGNMAPAASAP